MVDRPEDVGRAFDVETGGEGLALRERLDDRALVLAVVALDALPEDVDLGSADAALRITSRIDEMRCFPCAELRAFEAKLSFRVGLLEHLAVPLLLGDRPVVLLAAQKQVPQRTEQAALRLEGEVDGLRRDACVDGDLGDRRRGVAVLLEPLLAAARIARRVSCACSSRGFDSYRRVGLTFFANSLLS